MKNILSLRQDERLQTLRRAFHIEDYKIARDNAEYVKRALDLERQAEETLSKGLEERQREIGGDLKERKGELERSLQKVRSEMEALNERLRAIMEDETMADSALREVSDRISKLEQLGDSKKRIEAELRKLEDDRRKAAEEIRRLERKKGGEVVAEDPGIGLEEARAREDEINRRLKAVTEEIASLDGERRAVEARIKGKQDALRKDEERLSRIRSTRSEIQGGRLEGLGAVEIEGDESELNSRLREIERDIDRATLEIGTLSNQIENFRRLEETGVCPTCRRPVSRGEYESERVRHQDELKKAEEKRDALRAEKDEISRRLDSIREMRMKLGGSAGTLRSNWRYTGNRRRR
ncbi:hypothetical protein [Thermogymnomonas acidicola]|uniref:hypothetical protein n=1 Tax=Thermogymnomonas acidicola TaxID=399579 RepID=UPI000946739E|nr:hypothetical protein [Thermogymnomonas acidicola]